MAEKYKWTEATDGVSRVRYLSGEDDRVIGRVTYNMAGAYVAWDASAIHGLYLTADAAMTKVESLYKLGTPPIPRP